MKPKPEQYLRALEQANEIRFARAKLKRAMKAGECDITALVLNPPDYIRTMRVREFLDAIWWFGDHTVKRVMLKASIALDATMGGLPDRSRHALIKALHTHRPRVMQERSNAS